MCYGTRLEKLTNSSASDQEIPSILRNPQAHNRIHNNSIQSHLGLQASGYYTSYSSCACYMSRL